MNQKNTNTPRFTYETPELTGFQYRGSVVIGGDSTTKDINPGDEFTEDE